MPEDEKLAITRKKKLLQGWTFIPRVLRLIRDSPLRKRCVDGCVRVAKASREVKEGVWRHDDYENGACVRWRQKFLQISNEYLGPSDASAGANVI